MSIRFLCIFLSISSATIYCMQPNNPLYITTSDEQTILIPNELIPYFKTFETMQEDLAHETNQNTGVPFPYYTSKALNFMIRLARAIHENQDIRTVLMTSALFLTPEQKNELRELLNYLDPIEPIKDAFATLFVSIKKASEVTYSAQPQSFITLKIGGKLFDVKRSLIVHMKHIDDMLQEFEKSVDNKKRFMTQPLEFPENSILNTVDPDTFSLLINSIERYANAHKTEDKQADITKILTESLSTKNTPIPVARIVELVNLVDILEVTVLEEPLITLIADWIQNNMLNEADSGWTNLNVNNMHLLKKTLISRAFSRIESFTMQNAEPKLILSPKMPNVFHVAFAQNGLSAVMETKDTLYFVDLEKKIISHTHTFPFIIQYIALSNDGSLVAIHSIEKTNQKNTIHFLDIKNRTLMPNILTLPEHNDVAGLALSPDNEKICIATNRNKIFVYNTKDLKTPLNSQDLNEEQEEEQLTREFRIHWFPNSLKCAVTSFCYETEKKTLYIIGTNHNFTKVITTVEEEPSHMLALPLDDTSLLCIQEGKKLRIKIFPSDTSVTPAEQAISISNCITRSPENNSTSAEGALLSNTKKYSLIFAREGNYIINNETGQAIKAFDSEFSGCFDKNDTGFFAYDYNEEQFKDSIIFYPFMNQESILLKALLQDLSFIHVAFFTKLIHAIASQKRIFETFSIHEKTMLNAISAINIKQLEAYFAKLHKFYIETLCAQEENSTTDTESSTETSFDADSDAMDIDDINTNTPQRTTPRHEPVAAPQQTQTQQPDQWYPPYEEGYIIDTLPMEIDDEYNTDYFPELSKQFDAKKQ